MVKLSFEDYLTSLDAEDGSLWGTARAFRKNASPISALNGPNGVALSDTNKTELIALSLESQFQLNDIHNPHKDDIITNAVDAYIANHTNNNNIDPIPPALPSELITYIKKIKIKKSPGRDGITNKMIKNLPLITIFKITNIINNMFNLRYFPNAWKTAVIIPILKPGKDPTRADSHRPISLLPILSKLAEKIISARLNDYLERNNILTPEQHGFRPRLSTSHQLLRVVEFIKDATDRNQYTAAVFLDIQKAFDRFITLCQDHRVIGKHANRGLAGSRDIIYIYVEQNWRDGTALRRSSVNFSFSRMDIIDFDREGSVRKQLRLISGREILSLYTPPPEEAGVMWRVRLGSRVVGELRCRYR
ncbi:probable RNA-directed DNA polymerase from transposon X-element [Trichonephila clavipes]|nr:probable RNA-directed DNA polymerase from transposon X-element [Trichonephila clavipes]